MKKYLTIVIILACMFASLSSAIYAHEFSKPQRWTLTSGPYRITRVNHDYLNANSFFQNNISSAVYNWTVNPTKSYCMESSFSTSTVDIVTPTQSWWDFYNLGGFFAVTFASDTNNYTFYTNPGSQYSNGLIKYGAIYVNPDNYTWGYGENCQTSVIVHEIGHLYGLWHCPQLTVSIMRPDADDSSYTTLQTHDVSDMNGYYP